MTTLVKVDKAKYGNLGTPRLKVEVKDNIEQSEHGRRQTWNEARKNS